MDKEKITETITHATLEEELEKNHTYGSGYRSCSWFIVIGEEAMASLNLTYENLPDFIQKNFNVLYACWDEEKSDKGKTHLHLYMELDNKVRFNTMINKMPGAHIDRRYGSPSEARLYIEKPKGVLFKGKEKTHKVVKSIQEFVSLLVAFQNKQYETFLNKPFCIKHTNTKGVTIYTVDRKVYYLYGSAGCGKTEGVKRKYGEDEVSKITNLKADMKFDDYSNNGVILFDEFYSQLPLHQMLNLLDNKITKLPCRYENKYNLAHTIILTSNNLFEQQYPNAKFDNPETYAAFCRRFTGGIWEMYQSCENASEKLGPVYMHTGTRYIAMKQGPINMEPPIDDSDPTVKVVSYQALQIIKSTDKLDFTKTISSNDNENGEIII